MLLRYRILLPVLLLWLTACQRDKDYTDYTTPPPKKLSLKGESLKGNTELVNPDDGAIVMLLNDGLRVDTRPVEEDNWQLVSLFVAITPQQAKEFVIAPGLELRSTDGDVVGRTIDSVYIWYVWENTGLIGGYTQAGHIDPESVPENILSALLAEGKLMRKDLHAALNYSGIQVNHFDTSGIATEVYIEESMTYDAPVTERIALLFGENDSLLAIVHSRQLNTPQYTTYRFDNNYLLTVTANLTQQQLDKIVNVRYEKFMQAQAAADRQRGK